MKKKIIDQDSEKELLEWKEKVGLFDKHFWKSINDKEGFVSTTYIDPVGYKTIGKGSRGPVYKRRFGKELKMGDRISMMQADLLVIDYALPILKKIKDLKLCQKSEKVKNLLILFFYNVGANKVNGTVTTKLAEEFATTSKFYGQYNGRKPVKDGLTFAGLIDLSDPLPLCKYISWWRKAGGKVFDPFVRRRDELIEVILKETNNL